MCIRDSGNGTWEDRLVEIEKDIDSLTKIVEMSKQISVHNQRHEFGKTNMLFNNGFDAIVPSVIKAKDTLQVIFKSNKFTEETQIARVHYRMANMTLGEFNNQQMTWNGSAYVAQIPTESLNPDFDLLVYFTSVTSSEEVVIYPGIFNENHNMPYYTIEIKE